MVLSKVEFSPLWNSTAESGSCQQLLMKVSHIELKISPGLSR